MSQAESIRGISWECSDQGFLTFGCGRMWMRGYRQLLFHHSNIKVGPTKIKWVLSSAITTKSWFLSLILEATWVSFQNEFGAGSSSSRQKVLTIMQVPGVTPGFESWSFYYLGILKKKKEYKIIKLQPDQMWLFWKRKENTSYWTPGGLLLWKFSRCCLHRSAS